MGVCLMKGTLLPQHGTQMPNAAQIDPHQLPHIMSEERHNADPVFNAMQHRAFTYCLQPARSTASGSSNPITQVLSAVISRR